MPEPDLSHIDAILADLGPLASKQRGAPLRADDWNVVVDAVRELTLITRGRAGQSADALAANYAPIDHQHLGQVGLDWFDGPTRALVEGRSQTPFTVRDDLARLDKGVNSLRGEVGELRNELTSLRELVLQLRDEVIGGKRMVGKLELRVEAVRDLEVGVDRIGRNFAELDGRLGEVLSFRDQIGAGEDRIDLGALGQRVGELEQLRHQLVGASQAPDLRVIQQDLVKLSDRFAELGPGAPVDLSDAGRAQIEQLLDAGLAGTKSRLDSLESTASANQTLLEQHAATLADLPKYDAGLSRLDALEGQVDTLGKHDVELSNSLGELGTTLSGLDGLLDKKLAGLELGRADEELVAGLGARLDQLGASVDERFTALGDLDTRFAGSDALAELGGSLTQLEERTNSRLDQFDTLRESVAEVGAGVDDLGTRLGSLEGGALAFGDWRSKVDGRLSALADLGSGQREAALAQRVGELESSVTTWNTWRTGANGRLDTLEIGTVTAGEARTALADGLAKQGETLAKLDNRVGTLTIASKALGEWQLGVDGQLGTLASFEGMVATLGKELSTTTASVKTLSDSLAKTSNTLAGLSSWQLGVNNQLLQLDGKTAALSDWRASADKRLTTSEQSIGSLSALGTRVTTLETATTSMTTWQRQASTVIGELQVGVAKANETRMFDAARMQPMDIPTRFRPL